MLIHCRWMIARDLPEVCAVERGAGGDWGADRFEHHLQHRNCIGTVAERGAAVVGFMVYELHRTRVTLLKFGAPDEQTAPVLGAKLLDKLDSHRRTVLVWPVPAAWRTSDVLGLCRDRRRTLCPPILADALEEAGCACPFLLTGLRTGARAHLLANAVRAGLHTNAPRKVKEPVPA